MNTRMRVSVAEEQRPWGTEQCLERKGAWTTVYSILIEKEAGWLFHYGKNTFPPDDTLDFSKPSGATRQHGAGVCKAITDDWDERADYGVCTLSVKFLLPLR